MTHKNYVLDTSTLLHDPRCFEKFVDNNVVIPLVVLEELDHIKIRSDATGANARIVIRYIDSLMGENVDFEKGIDIGNSTFVFFDKYLRKDERFSAGGKDDNILACAAHYENAVLVTKDVNMRIRAKACGIKAEDYKNDKVSVDELYTGSRFINLDEMGIFIEDLTPANGLDSCDGTIFETLFPNEFAQVVSNGVSSIYRKRANGSLKPVRLPPKGVWGLQSRNMEQAFALDLLLDPNVPLVTLIGKAGAGKSLLTIGAALELVLDQKKYTKAELYKVIMSVGKDLGYLPGDLAEKLGPWMGSMKDALEYLAEGTNFETFMHMYKEKIKMEALTYVRGRSMNKVFIMLDEAQNSTKNEIKTLITRAGFDSKIVLLGDIEQIDNHYLDAMDNGLTYVIEQFKTSKLAGHVTLVKGERSPLATEASKIL